MAINRQLSALGYRGELAKKGGRKPDGCALFFRTEMFFLHESVRIEYRDAMDGQPNSGHVVQVAVLKQGNRALGIANTHLKWDQPSAFAEKQYGYRQIIQLLGECEARTSACKAWIVCGDLNAEPSSDVIVAMRKAGFEFAHHAYKEASTSNANGKAKTIDYLFHSAAFQSRPEPLPVIDDHTPLPRLGQPSDHVAVVARFEWADSS